MHAPDEMDRFQSSSMVSIHKEPRGASQSTKHHTMIDKGTLNVEEFSKDHKKGFYSPEKKSDPNTANQYRLLHKDQASVSPELIQARVFAEYFSMIDDLVIVADMKLKIISNNFSAKILQNVINKFNKNQKRINMHNLKAEGTDVYLDHCFLFTESDQIRCNEETAMNLIDIYTKLKKHHPDGIKRFKDSKLERILRCIESLERGIKISKREEEKDQSSHFRKISKLKSSMRAINIKKSNLTVDNYYEGM